MKILYAVFVASVFFVSMQAQSPAELTPEQVAAIIAELQKRGIDVNAVVSQQQQNGRVRVAGTVVVVDNSNGASGQAHAMAQRVEPVKEQRPDLVDIAMKQIQFFQMVLWLARLFGVPLPF